MNSVHPAAGYSAAGKPRTQEEQEMDFEIPKYRKCRPPRFETPLSRKVLRYENSFVGHKIEWNSKPRQAQKKVSKDAVDD